MKYRDWKGCRHTNWNSSASLLMVVIVVLNGDRQLFADAVDGLGRGMIRTARDSSKPKCYVDRILRVISRYDTKPHAILLCLGHDFRRACAKTRLLTKGSFLYGAPGGIGIEFSDCCCRLRRGLPQILLEEEVVLVDDKGHHSRVAVLRRIGNDGESSSHLLIDKVDLCASRRPAGLPFQHPEVVAMEWGVRIGLCAVSFGSCECGQRAEWALGLTFGRLPVQAVMLSRIADELQGVLFCGCAIMKLREVRDLSVCHRLTNIDDCQLIPANAAIQNLLFSSGSVEEPLCAIVLLQRDGEGEIVSTHNQDLGTVTHPAPPVHHLVSC